MQIIRRATRCYCAKNVPRLYSMLKLLPTMLTRPLLSLHPRPPPFSRGYCPQVTPGCLAFTVQEAHLCAFASAIPLSWNFPSCLFHLMNSYSSFCQAGSASSRKPPWDLRLAPFLCFRSVCCPSPAESTPCLHTMEPFQGQKQVFPTFGSSVPGIKLPRGEGRALDRLKYQIVQF